MMERLFVFIEKVRNFNIENFFNENRWSVTFFLIGAILIGLGVIYIQNDQQVSSSKIEILESTSGDQRIGAEVVVEIAGAVENPGVFKLSIGDRIEDALILAGGISADADRDWMEKVLNRAAKLSDGQKIYIPRQNEQSDVLSAKNNGGIKTYQSENDDWGSGLVNVNTATTKELEVLWGIGPVTAQNIIEQRPYSSVEELLRKKILKSNVYERNKDKLTVY